jgi:hypothetical protein
VVCFIYELLFYLNAICSRRLEIKNEPMKHGRYGDDQGNQM